MAALSMSAVPMPEAIEIDSNDDDWTAYFSNRGMLDIPDIPDIPDIVIAPVTVMPMPVNHRHGRVPIDPLTSAEEVILDSLMAACQDPESKVKIRQWFMTKQCVRARLAMNYYCASGQQSITEQVLVGNHYSYNIH